jgi:hypothetical protein
MAKEHSSDVCAPCHYSSDRHPKGYSWESTAHAISSSEGPTNPQYTNRNTCSTCHIGQGFVNERINGNPAPSSGYANPASIGCVTCHDPHSNQGIARRSRTPARLAIRPASAAVVCITRIRAR